MVQEKWLHAVSGAGNPALPIREYQGFAAIPAYLPEE